MSMFIFSLKPLDGSLVQGEALLNRRKEPTDARHSNFIFGAGEANHSVRFAPPCPD
jgi:hypothetical protein